MVRSRLKNIGFVVALIAFISAGGGSALASSVTVTVTVPGGNNAGAGTLPLASGQTPTTFSVAGGDPAIASKVVSPLDPPCDRYSTITGTDWITAATSQAPCGPNDGVGKTTTYTVTFALPAGSTSPHIDGSFYADNRASVALNDTQLAAQVGAENPANYGYPPTPPSEAPPPTPFGSSSGFLAGTNTLTFTVDDSSEVTGLDYVATVTYDLPADLSVSVDDGALTAVPGNGATYTIAATNNGPGDVTGAQVDDNFPAAFGSVNWTCTATLGGSCPASGSGDVHQSVDLPTGAKAVFTATGTISPAETGSVANTATVTAPVGVTDAAGNNSQTDTTTLTPQADLEPTIVSPSSPQVAGAQTGFDYQVKVTNNGPSNFVGSYSVTGTLPAGFSFDPSGGCTGSGQSFTCSSGSGVTAGAFDTYPVHVRVAPSVPDGSSPSAIVALTSDGTYDQNGENNSAGTDPNVSIIARADLQPTIAAPSGNQVAGDPGGFDYTLIVTNNGPSDNIGGYTLAGVLPTGVSFASAKLNGSPTGVCGSGEGGFGFSCAVTATMPHGTVDTLLVHVTVDHSVGDSSPDASVTVSSGGTIDDNSENDTAHTSPDVVIVTRADLAFDSVSRAPSPIYANITPAQNTVTYTVTFHNAGPSDARHSTLKLNPALAVHLTGAEWCQVVGASCGPYTAYTAAGIDAGQVAPTAPTTLLIRAHTIPSDRNGPFSVTQGFALSVPAPTTDPNGANNTTSASSTEVDTVPSPVRNVQAVAGNANAIVTFEPPSNTGGQPITQYLVTLTPAGGGSPITVPASAPQVLCPNGVASDCYRLNISPLVNGTLYTIDVQARNAVGLSDLNPATRATVTPSANAAASIVAPAQTGSLTTCATATPTSPTCAQYVIPSGAGGVFGSLGNITFGQTGFPANLCGGSACIGQGGTANNTRAGAQNLGALAGYNDRTKPLQEIITWDATTIPTIYTREERCRTGELDWDCYPNNVPVYYETSFVLANFPTATGTRLNFHFCGFPVIFGGAGNSSFARPKPSRPGPYNGYLDTAGSACIKQMSVLSSRTNPAVNGDVQVTINLTSDSDALAGHH